MRTLRLASLAATTFALTMAAAPLAAQNVVDQKNTTFGGLFGSANDWSAQTFKTTATNLSGAGAYLYQSTTGTQSLSVSLWNNNPSTGGTQLATSTVSFNLGSNGYGWVDAFWAPVATVAGQTYWLTVGNGSSSTYTSHGTSASNYANGGAYFNYSPTPTSTYGDWTGYDLDFRTYTSTAANVTATPEPATWALMGMGLVSLAGVARRRRSGATA